MIGLKTSILFDCKLSMVCPICEQTMTFKKMREGDFIKLIGAAPGTMDLCKNCGQLVESVTPEYKARSRKPRIIAGVG